MCCCLSGAVRADVGDVPAWCPCLVGTQVVPLVEQAASGQAGGGVRSTRDVMFNASTRAARRSSDSAAAAAGRPPRAAVPHGREGPTARCPNDPGRGRRAAAAAWPRVPRLPTSNLMAAAPAVHACKARASTVRGPRRAHSSVHAVLAAAGRPGGARLASPEHLISSSSSSSKVHKMRAPRAWNVHAGKAMRPHHLGSHPPRSLCPGWRSPLVGDNEAQRPRPVWQEPLQRSLASKQGTAQHGAQQEHLRSGWSETASRVQAGRQAGRQGGAVVDQARALAKTRPVATGDTTLAVHPRWRAAPGAGPPRGASVSPLPRQSCVKAESQQQGTGETAD